MSIRAILDEVAEEVGFHPYYSELESATEKSYVGGDDMISLTLRDEDFHGESMRCLGLSIEFNARSQLFKYNFSTNGFTSCGSWHRSCSGNKLTQEQLRTSLVYILGYSGFYFDDNEDYAPYDKSYLASIAKRDDLCDCFAELSVGDY